MADTIANIQVEPDTPTDLYIATGISIGTKINVAMIGYGNARLIAIAELTSAPDDSTGYRDLETGQEFVNDAGDSGAWIWSAQGCTVNVKEVV